MCISIYIYYTQHRSVVSVLVPAVIQGDHLSNTRSPSQDFRLFGPRPWKILATAYGKIGS